LEQKMKTVKTPKGTELPIRDMKGKDYLDVAWRVLWMREEHPDWGIETEFLQLANDVAIAKATVRDGTGKILAQGTKSETPGGFSDFIEKSETGAIGRALALCGYGTQFTQDLDEGERIVDSPQASKPKIGPVLIASSIAADGSYVIKCGKKYFGQSLQKIGPHDAVNYANWLRSEATAKNKPLTGDFLEAVNAIEAFARSRESK
jgi:hypothetical protein